MYKIMAIGKNGKVHTYESESKEAYLKKLNKWRNLGWNIRFNFFVA